MDVLIGHTGCEVSELGEEIVEEIRLINVQETLKRVDTVHLLEFLQDQHAQVAHYLKLGRETTECKLKYLCLDADVKCFILEEATLSRLANFSKKLVVKAGEILFVDRETCIEGHYLKHRDCHLLEQVGAELFLNR